MRKRLHKKKSHTRKTNKKEKIRIKKCTPTCCIHYYYYRLLKRYLTDWQSKRGWKIFFFFSEKKKTNTFGQQTKFKKNQAFEVGIRRLTITKQKKG